MQCMAHVAINRSSYGSISHRINITHHITSQMWLCSVFSLQQATRYGMSYVYIGFCPFVAAARCCPFGQLAIDYCMTFCLFQAEILMRNEQANDEKPQMNQKRKKKNEMQQNSMAQQKKLYVFSVQLMTGIINKIKFIQLSVVAYLFQYAVCKSNNKRLTQDF